MKNPSLLGSFKAITPEQIYEIHRSNVEVDVFQI